MVTTHFWVNKNNAMLVSVELMKVQKEYLFNNIESQKLCPRY